MAKYSSLPVLASLGLLMVTAKAQVTVSPAAGSEPVLHLNWVSTGISDKSQFYAPNNFQLSSSKPYSIKKEPDGLTAPLYGQVTLGPKETPTVFPVILCEPTRDTAKLYIDLNRNGDLTDDPPVEWKWKNYPNGTGGYEGQATFSISYGGGTTHDATLHFYRFDPNEKKELQSYLFYYADYGWAGTIDFGSHTVSALLLDMSDSGDFTDGRPGILYLSYDTNRKPGDSPTECPINKPVIMDNVAWDVTGLTADGQFRLVKCSQSVAEIQAKQAADREAALNARRLANSAFIGKPAEPFKGTTTGGRAVNFPDDYKGKIVLVDFWATWCGPCMAEVPNVVKAYGQYHSKGLEVLGISLDDKVNDHFTGVLKEKGMTWDQICDGNAWSCPIVQLYGVHGIPHMILVDGTTGKILAYDPRGPGFRSSDCCRDGESETLVTNGYFARQRKAP